MSLLVLDVSHWQSTTPNLDGVSGLIARASIGTQTDEMYDTHIRHAEAQGKVTGSYHFSDNGSTAKDQLRVYLAKSGPSGIKVLDVEGARRMSEAQGRYFIAGLQDAGHKAVMYASDSGFPYWGQDYNWVASYSYKPSRTMVMWQYGPYHGVDGNQFFGTLDDLRTLAGEGMTQLPITDQTPKLVTTKADSTWFDLDGSVLSTGHSALSARLSPYGVGNKRAVYGANGVMLISPLTVTDLPTGPGADCSVQEAALAEALTTIAGEPGRTEAAIEADRANAKVGVIYEPVP
jgi:hypothetical protein